ncbi:MAG: fused MFS/spermidine synthase [Verrucomicrobiia bacterium]
MANQFTASYINNRFDRLVVVSIVLLGVTALSTQLVLMRELLSTFNGSELSIGIILGSWLFLSGIGSYIGKHFRFNPGKKTVSVLYLFHLIIALIPLLEIAAIRLFRDKVFIRGSTIGVIEMVCSCLIILLPFCVISGIFLVIACDLASGKFSAGKIYIADGIGSAIGGLLFSFILIQMMDHFQLLSIIAVINLLWCSILCWNVALRMPCAISGSLLAALLLVLFRYNVDLYLTQKQYPDQKILFHGNSPYGRVVATEFEHQINFFENGVPLSPSHNIQQAEETVHFVMAQRPYAKKVLLISGGYAGTAREILKYGVEKIDYVEIDSLIIRLAEKFLKTNIAFPQIHIINTDGRKYTRETAEKYDVIIVDVPDPVTSQLNRFYTYEFFSECRRILNPGGAISFGISHYENFVSDELAKVLSAAAQTLKLCFKNYLAIPAGRVYFIASDGALTLDIASALDKNNIQTKYVRPGYINSITTPDRLGDIKEACSNQTRINKDFYPTLYFYNILRWVSQFRIKFGIMEAVLILILVFYVAKLRLTELTIFSSGFTGATLELVIILAYQTLYGSIYLQLSLIITLFMLGLTAGAWGSKLWLEHTTDSLNVLKLAILAAAIALCGVITYPLLVLFSKSLFILLYLGQIGIAALIFIIAFIAGAQFPVAFAIESKTKIESASKIYGADFIGAAIGSLISGTLLIPVIGVAATCLITTLFNGLCAILLLRTYKKIG